MKTILSVLGVLSAIFFNSAPQVIQLDSNESVELARDGSLCADAKRPGVKSVRQS